MDKAYLYRMPVGFPGAITRSSGLVVEAHLLDPSVPFASAFGLPLKLTPNGRARLLEEDDDASEVHGFLVRSDGDSAAPRDILRSGYMAVRVNAGTPDKTAPVCIRVANPTLGCPVGGIEALLGPDTVALPGCVFTGPMDSSGMVEIACNIRN